MFCKKIDSTLVIANSLIYSAAESLIIHTEYSFRELLEALEACDFLQTQCFLIELTLFVACFTMCRARNPMQHDTLQTYTLATSLYESPLIL